MGFHYFLYFWAFVPFAALLCLYLWSGQKRRRDLLRMGQWQLLKQNLSVEAMLRRKRKDLVALLGLVLLLLAATGPQFGARLKEMKQRGMDVFIAIDTSRSMLAEDVQPSRLDHAKRSLGLLIDKLTGNRVGIIAFAKYPVIQCPLTTDIDAAGMFLDIVDSNTVPKQGTALGEAIRLAVNSFNYDDKTGKAVVLLTDGEDHESDPMGAAALAKEKGVVLFTLGIGTSKGEVIKDRDEQGNLSAFHKFKGEMVVSRLDDALLTKMASLTGGRYYHASTSDREIDDIAQLLNDFDKKEFASKTYERLQERYQIFALLAFLILLLEFFFSENPGQVFRIKRLFKGVFVLLFFAAPLQADMKTHIQKGNKWAQKKDFAAARKEFESAQIDAPEMPYIPYNIALTYYAEGDFEASKKQFEKTLAMTNDPDLMAKTYYNLGHVAYAMGQTSESLNYFKDTLKINPRDEEAKYNIEYIKSGKAPKNNPQKNNQKKNPTDDKGPQNPTDEEKKKPGDISKEEAERILQMIKDQEKEKLKNARPAQPEKNQKDKKDDAGAEDW